MPRRSSCLALVAGLAGVSASGCITYDGSRGIPPIFEIRDDVAKSAGPGGAAEFDAPRVEETVPSREYILRPLGGLEFIGAERRRIKFLWPLGDFAWGAGHNQHWILPFFLWRQKPSERFGGTDTDFMLFPFVWAGHEPGLGSYFAVLPLGGMVRDVLAKDKIIFVLFPLYWKSWDRDFKSLFIVWPFYNVVWGGGYSGWRLWPFYGSYASEDRVGNPRYRRWFVLWPFYMRDQYALNSRNPKDLFFTFPFYGRESSPWFEKRSYLWPLFISEYDKRKDQRLIGGFLFPYRFGPGQYDFWPIFGWKKKTRTRSESEALVPTVASTSEGRDDEIVQTRFRQYALWPIQRYESEETETIEKYRFWLVPLYWRFYTAEKEPPRVTLSHSKVWPLYRYRREGDRTTFYFPSPLWFRQENLFERQWARLWRLFLYLDSPERAGWEFLYGFLAHRYEKEARSRTISIFYGFLEWESAPSGHGFRFLWLPWK